MKTLSILLGLLVAATAANGQLPTLARGVEPLRAVDPVLPVFPQEMLKLGVREGHVRVAFSVDTNGKVEDCLAVAYTHPEFARVSVNSMKRWRFEPAKLQGQPIPASAELTLKFQVEGTVVVSMTASETVAALMHSMVETREGYRPRTLKELDRIPTPIATSSPQLPARFENDPTPGRVTVSFYIDETGAVRMPSVSDSEDPELSAAAISALRGWKFEPPRWKGRPVLVRASQQFNFSAPRQ